MKCSTSARSGVIVIEPTEMSQRPFQPPEMIVSHAGASQATSTPSRSAISVATSMSKPSYSFVSSFSSDWGGYAGSVETVRTPFSSIAASRSPSAPLPSSSPPPQEAPTSASAKTRTASTGDSRFGMCPPSLPGRGTGGRPHDTSSCDFSIRRGYYEASRRSGKTRQDECGSGSSPAVATVPG